MARYRSVRPSARFVTLCASLFLPQNMGAYFPDVSMSSLTSRPPPQTDGAEDAAEVHRHLHPGPTHGRGAPHGDRLLLGPRQRHGADRTGHGLASEGRCGPFRQSRGGMDDFGRGPHPLPHPPSLPSACARSGGFPCPRRRSTPATPTASAGGLPPPSLLLTPHGDGRPVTVFPP